MEKIQRVPRGLNELLSLAGGQTPIWLGESVAPVLELLQFYGLTQLQSRSSTDPAAAEGSGTGVTLSATAWTVLFGAEVSAVKTATMTALSLGLLLRRNISSFVTIAAAEAQRFGATETGPFVLPFRPASPILCPPGTVVFGGVNILGTDATASVSCAAEFGILG